MWEYKVEGFGTVSPTALELNTAAVGGWRLVAMVTARNGLAAVFEREIVEEASDSDIQIAIMMALEQEDRPLRQLITQAYYSGEWDGTLAQLVNIADGHHPIKGIGPKRQERLRDVIRA